MQPAISDHMKEMSELEFEYEPGDIIPVTSCIYRVVYDGPDDAEHLRTFYAGQRFRLVQIVERTCDTCFPVDF